MKALLLFLLCICLQSSCHAQEQQCSSDDEDIAGDYLRNHSGGHDAFFKIHGWRWHTLAVLREVRLIEKNLLSISNVTLQQLVDHTISFNLKGLQQVERNLFHPWLKEKISLVPHEAARLAFQHLIEYSIRQQELLTQGGNAMVGFGLVFSYLFYWVTTHIAFHLV